MSRLKCEVLGSRLKSDKGSERERLGLPTNTVQVCIADGKKMRLRATEKLFNFENMQASICTRGALLGPTF